MKKVNLSWLSRPQICLLAVALAVFVIALITSPAGSELVRASQALVTPDHGPSAALPVIQTNATTKAPISQTRSSASQKSTDSRPMLALSFDDGPNPLTTPLILSTLEKYQVNASFFVVGNRIAGSEALLRRMYKDGDDIGNHSWSHPDFAKLTGPQIEAQINKTQAAVAAAGVPAPFMFRPPYEIMGKNFPSHLPIAVILWNIDPRDWADRNAASVASRITSEAKPGGIIDMHGIYQSTAEAVGIAIPQLKQKYQLVTVSELLGIKPGATGFYYGQK